MENKINSTQSSYSDSERIFALLSHLSLLLGGIVLPIIIWATMKDKSQFVRFHSLQAIFYQLSLVLVFFVFIIIMILAIILLGGSIGILSTASDEISSLSFLTIFIFIAFYGGMILISLGAVVYAVYLAIRSYNGYWIKVPVIGNIILNRIHRS